MRLEAPATEKFLDTIPIPILGPDEIEPDERRRRPSRTLAIAGAVIAVLAFGAASYVVIDRRASAKTSPVVENAPPIQTIDAHGWRFTVHLPTGAESLYDLEKDPRCRQNVLQTNRTRAAQLRSDLLRRCGVRTMEQLREPHRDLTEALRRLGYL